MTGYILAGFIFFTGLVAIISFLNTRKEATSTLEGLFFANRKNSFWIVGGALFLSNLSANQFVGENESVFINNMSVIAWGISSVLAMLLVSEFVLPIYFRTNSMTIPDFLGKRYDHSTKRFVSLIFMLSYMISLLPAVLYGGAVAITGLFDVFEPLGLAYWPRIWIMVWVIGLIGASYSILGGLRAINISETALSLGFLIIGLSFPYFGFKYLGDGSWSEGVRTVLSNHQEHLNAIGSVDDEVPFWTIFTGMFIMNLHYWGMEQYIVQQAMTAKDLSQSQKGMALACGGKLLSPVLINIPGVIGVHLYSGLDNTAEVFSLVVKDTLPVVLIGLTAAVVFGAAIATFNAGLKSSSTLFVLYFYKPWKEKRSKTISDKDSIRSSKRFEIAASLCAMIGAPFIIFADTGFYTYLQQLAGVFAIPIFTIVLLGFLSKKVSPIAAKIGTVFFMFSYVLLNYIVEVRLHYLHLLAVLFLITALFMLTWSKLYPDTEKKIFHTSDSSMLIPWKNRHLVGLGLVMGMVLVFLLFSPMGIA